MLNSQIQLDFTVHVVENNVESQMHLEKNRVAFGGQCLKVFNLLLNGSELTSKVAMTDYNIGHLARRILDLKENGVLIGDKWVEGVKVWFMTPEQIEFNKTLNK